MSRSHTDPPERLLDGGGTEFERRLLVAGTHKGPSPDMVERMAGAIGVSATTVGAAAIAKNLASEVATAKATASVGAAAWLPWITVGVLALAVAGVVVGTRAGKNSPDQLPPSSVTANAPAHPSSRNLSPSVAGWGISASTASGPKPAPAVPSDSDLREQIAVIDLARSALHAGEGRRALEIVRRYQDTYPSGHFLPEATALKVESLVRIGRVAEARVLAARFVDENRGSMLAERVAKLAGLARP